MVAVNSHPEFQVKSSNIPPHNRALVSAALLFVRALETTAKLSANCYRRECKQGQEKTCYFGGKLGIGLIYILKYKFPYRAVGERLKGTLKLHNFKWERKNEYIHFIYWIGILFCFSSELSSECFCALCVFEEVNCTWTTHKAVFPAEVACWQCGGCK